MDGHVLDSLVRSRRDKRAVKTFFTKLLKGLPYVPRVIITDQLKSDTAANGEVMPGLPHRQHRSLNSRCELSHRPTRHCELRLQGFKPPVMPSALSAYRPIAQQAERLARQ